MMNPGGSEHSARQILRDLFDAAVASAQPDQVVPAHLPPPPRGRLVVVGAGKASAAMAQAVEQHWQAPLEGLVVTRYGHAVPCRRIEIVEAGHPVPDDAGLDAASRIHALVSGLGADDQVLCLISGGGSALLPAPAEGLTLADKQALSTELLKSGATISEMNCVRRHLSALKGGRLAAACHPARLLCLVISDVPGDHLPDIASGPTVADPSTCEDALEILHRYRIPMPGAVEDLLTSGRGESVKPGDPRLAGAETRLVASPQIGLEAAAAAARDAGYTPCILGDSIEGESREVARVMAGIARQSLTHGQPVPPPCALLSGGETTVTVRGTGRGGRNVEFLLALSLALEGQPGIHSLAADTDGIDGQEENAGAICTPETLRRAREQGLSPRDSLEDNDGHGFFEALDDVVVTGPTLTNINDFRVLLVDTPDNRRD